MRSTVLGASGFFGGHVAEQLAHAGHSVVAVVRPMSDRTFVDSLGVAVEPIDYTDASLLDAVRDAAVIYNCTADTRMRLD